MSRPHPATVLVLFAALAGCGGFQPVGGVSDGAVNADLAGDSGASMGGNGPGPLGAIPTGFCCSSSEQCRGRLCAQLGSGPYYCSDPCAADGDCTGWSTQYQCDLNIHRCVPVNDPYTCTDGATYHYGGLPTGACCASGGARAGEECQGTFCLQLGPQSNPGICSQGCDSLTTCPLGFGCHVDLEDKGRCWPNASLLDVDNAYTCK